MEQNLYNLYDDIRAMSLERRYKGAVVKIFCRESRQGHDECWTGFLICWNPCVIVTVFHPVKYISDYTDFLLAPTTFVVKFHGDEEFHPALAVKWNLASDILILCCACPLPPFEPTYFVFADPHLPMNSISLFSISHPQKRGWRSGRGMVCCPPFQLGEFQNFDPHMSVFDHSVQLFPGSSGGPLVDSMGRLRGMQFTEICNDEHVVSVRDKATPEEYRQLNQSQLSNLPHQINILKLRETNLKQGIHAPYINQKLRQLLDKDGLHLGTDLVIFLRQSPDVMSRVPPPRPTLNILTGQLITMNEGIDSNAPQQPLRSDEFELFRSQNSLGAGQTDLSLQKLEELQKKLQAPQKDKSDCLKQVLDHLDNLKSLCLVLGNDIHQHQTVDEVHPSLGNSLGTKSISNDTIGSLAVALQGSQELKIQSMQQLQDLATSMLEFWNLMETPIEEQQMFQNVTCNKAASAHELKEPNMLSEDSIKYVEVEVNRLETLKASKMKELVFKKRFELEDVCRKMRMISVSDSGLEFSVEANITGKKRRRDPEHILEQNELQIVKTKEEALSRREILEKVEKWMAACEEECWLQEYNKDENRYNSRRGTHLITKRAEKARALVNKIPGMVQTLALKTDAWEKERGTEFIYDGIRLLSMLEDYNVLTQKKEQELKNQKDQKKLKGQIIVEQEALFRSEPSPKKPQSLNKGSRLSYGGTSNQRLSLGGALLQTPKTDKLHSILGTPNTRQTKKNDQPQQNGQLNPRGDSGVTTL